MRQVVRVFVLLLAVSLFAGAGSSQAADDGLRRQIEGLLEEYVARIKSKEPTAIAEMYSYPYKTVHPDGEAKVYATKDELVRFLEAENAQIGDFEKIDVTVYELSQTGSTATAKAATRVTVLVEGTPTTFVSQVEFKFVKSGETWLISEEWTLAMDVSVEG